MHMNVQALRIITANGGCRFSVVVMHSSPGSTPEEEL